MMTTRTNFGLSKENILSAISQQEIMEKYLSLSIQNNKKNYKNPLRVDSKAGCTFYTTNSGILQFVDWARDKRYNCFEVVMEKYSCNFWESLKIIDQDFGLGLYSNRNLDKWRKNLIGKKLISGSVKNEIKKPENKKNLNFSYYVQEFTKKHLAYWEKGCIDLHILKFFNVFDTVSVNLNGKSYMRSTKTDPIYTYANKSNRVKFYRPHNKTGKKWRGNVKTEDVQGLEQLPDKGNLLFITSSLKDVMSLYSLGFSAIAPQSESILSEDILTDLKKRWDKIVILYDNDEPGIKIAKNFSEKCNLPWIVPSLAKDVFDSVTMFGYEKTREDLQDSLYKLD